MANRGESGITITEIRGWIPIVAILVSIILAWSSLSFQNSTNAININDAKSDIKDLKAQQKVMNDQLIKIATIIDSAQKNGQLSLNNKNGKTLAFAGTTSIAAIPTPIPTPQQTTPFVNQVFAQPTESKQADGSGTINPIPPTPEPQPQPTPQPTGLQQVLNAVGSIIGVR